MKAIVNIPAANLTFDAEFPHDVCIEEEIVFNNNRLVVIDIYLENVSGTPGTATSDHPVVFKHMVICEPADDSADGE